MNLADADQINALLTKLRNDVTDPNEPAQLVRFGVAILDMLSLHPTELLGTGVTAQQTRQLHEAVARQFLSTILPDIDALRAADARVLGEWSKALKPATPDPTMLAAAYGMARLDQFRGDRRLMYRVAGYRGKRGDLLADHLYETVITPARRSLGSG